MSTVRIAGLVFEEAPADFDRAYVVEPGGLRGWFEGIEMRREDAPRPVSHGSFDAPGYGSARVVSISGNIVAPSPAALDHMRAALTGLLADGGTARLSVEGPSGTTWADVGLAARTLVDEATTGTEAAFQLQFWSADPRRYGEARQVSPAASISVSHYGNAPAHPVLTVAGSSPTGYTINGPGGRQFVVTRPLVSGAPHTIDMATGWLSINDVVQVGGVGRADTWTIPPAQRIAISVSAGTVSAVVADTFI